MLLLAAAFPVAPLGVFRVLVAPMAFRRVVIARFRIIAAEQAVQVFGVLEPLIHNRGGIGVGQHILLEPPLVG